MGLLDDAIREHLDLKRRRGSDPAEVARLEQEALGPVRREPEPAADAAAGEHPHGDHEHREAVHHHDDVHDHAEHHAADEHPPDVAPHDPHAAPDPRHSDIVHQPTTELRVEDHHDDEHETHHEEPGAAHSAVEHHHDAPSPRPAADVSWADDLDHDEPATAEEPDAHDDDVLEETPEFLQETPEHDRLWFEQRPPRDFDFDG